MKFRDLIERSRDGVERPDSEKAIIARVVSEHVCSQCGQTDLCAYAIQHDAFFCSDECQLVYTHRPISVALEHSAEMQRIITGGR